MRSAFVRHKKFSCVLKELLAPRQNYGFWYESCSIPTLEQGTCLLLVFAWLFFAWLFFARLFSSVCPCLLFSDYLLLLDYLLLSERYVSYHAIRTFPDPISPDPRTKALQDERVTSKTGRLLNKGDVYKLLNNPTYVGEAAHKGQIFAGEHDAIVARPLWDQVHALLLESPRVRANKNRSQSAAMLKGLIFGMDGRALSPTHTRRGGRLYRYYVAQRVLKAQETGDGLVRRVSAAEIERAVVDQVRALLRQPEIVVGTWMAARAEVPGLTEDEVRDALCNLGPAVGRTVPSRAGAHREAAGRAGRGGAGWG